MAQTLQAGSANAITREQLQLPESLCTWHAWLKSLQTQSTQGHLLYDLLWSLLRATDVPKDSFDQVKMYTTCDGHPEVQQVPAHSPVPKSEVPPWLMLNAQGIALGHSPRLCKPTPFSTLSHQLRKQA